MAQWFEVKIRFDKMQKNGTVKKVTESYLADSLSFSEAEVRVSEEVKPFISGDFDIHAERKTKISEIFFGDGDKFYLVKVAFIVIDERTGTEKRTISHILVQADNFGDACDRFIDGMKSTMADWDIVSVSETPITDVYKAKLS